MDLGLKDKVVVVTGSSFGIGKAIAESFLNEGARVVITGRGKDRLENTRNELVLKYDNNRVLSYTGDLTAEKEIEECLRFVVDNYGTINVLVANVGSGRPDKNLSDKEEKMRMNRINFEGARYISEKGADILKQGSGGSIVFISSIAAFETHPALSFYSEAKSRLLSFTKILARRLAPYHIRVNAVAPGNIKFSGGRWEEIIKENPEVLETIEKEVPMGRFGTPKEVADIVVFLASDRASFVTGACWICDGWQT